MKRLNHCSPAAPSLPQRLLKLKLTAGWLAILTLTFGPGRAVGDTSWTGAASDTSWSSPGNWTSGVPAGTDTAYVINGKTAYVTNGVTGLANGLDIYGGSTVQVGFKGAATLSVAGIINIGILGNTNGTLALNHGMISANTISMTKGASYSDVAGTTTNVLTGANAGWSLDRDLTVVVKSQIQGTDGMWVRDGGTLILEGANTYTGGTIVGENTTVQIGNGGKIGNLGEGAVVNNGTVIFDRSNTTTISNDFSGNGDMVFNGGGRKIIRGANSSTGDTTINGGMVRVEGDGSLSSGDIVLSSGLEFSANHATVLAGDISGSGSLTVESNTVTLAGDNTAYTGDFATKTNGILRVGEGGLGSGDLSNDGKTVFTDTHTVSNSISGRGTVELDGTGTTVFTKDNSYTGDTVIGTNSTMQLGDGGSTGTAGKGNLRNDGALVVNRTNIFSVENQITGSGRVIVGGNSNTVVTLTKSNSFSGGFLIKDDVTVIAGTNYALGSGDLTVESGTLKAGDAGKTNEVVFRQTNYTNAAGATTVLKVAGATSSGGTNEYNRIVVQGTAKLDGTLIVESDYGYQALHNDVLVLVTATNVDGTYSTFSNKIDHSVLLEARDLDYSQVTNAILRWNQLSFANFLATNHVNLTRNQTNVAVALDSIRNSTATNDEAVIDYLNNDLVGTNDVAAFTNALPQAFDDIAPEELTSMMVAAFANMDAQGNAFLNRAGELRAQYGRAYMDEFQSRTPGNMRLRPDFEEEVNKRWNYYFGLPLNFVGVDGDKNAKGYDINTAGVNLGADHQLNPHTFFGGAVGYTKSDASLSGGGSVTMDAFNVQLYGVWFRKGLHLEGLLGGNFNSYKTDRQALNGKATGSADGFGWTGLLSGGYDMVSGPWQLGPQVSIQYMSASVSEFTEQGSEAPLRILSQSEDAMHSQVGLNLRYRYYFEDSWTFLSPQFYFGWRHDMLGNEVSIDSKFASGNGDTFTVKGPALGSDSVVAMLGFSIQWNPSFNTWFNFTTQTGRSGYSAQNVNFGAQLSF